MGHPTNFFSFSLPLHLTLFFSFLVFFPPLSLPFISVPSCHLPSCPPFMSVLGTSLVGVSIYASPGYFCLPLPVFPLGSLCWPLSISNSACFLVSCVSWWLWGLCLPGFLPMFPSFSNLLAFLIFPTLLPLSLHHSLPDLSLHLSHFCICHSLSLSLPVCVTLPTSLLIPVSLSPISLGLSPFRPVVAPIPALSFYFSPPTSVSTTGLGGLPLYLLIPITHPHTPHLCVSPP